MPVSQFLNETVDMEADDEFQRQLDLFVRCSDEKARVLALLKRLVNRLPSRQAFLDVGAGAGDLAIPLSRRFETTTVVEPNQLQAARLLAAFPHFRVHDCTFQEATLEEGAFDLILCSHVLYYLPETEWMAAVQKMHDCLRPGGIAVIILQSPAGEMADFFEHFIGRQVPVIALWDNLVTRFGEEAAQAHYWSVEMRTATLEEMTSLGLFLLLDRSFRQRSREIRAYFAAHHRHGDGYRLRQGEIVLSVGKA